MTAPWQPTTAYAPGATVYGVPSTGFLYTASAGGTSGTSPPAFPTVLAGTVGDGSGSLVWTCTAVVADYSQFQVGNIVFPLAVAGGSTGVLQIADPALFYALDFWTFVIENYCGAAILAALAAAGVTAAPASITSSVMQTYPYEPTPEFLENQIQLPALFAYRTTLRTEWHSVGYEFDVQEIEVAYVLPPLDAKGCEIVLPLLNAVSKALRRKSTDAFDPAYTPPTPYGGSAGVAGEQVTAPKYMNAVEWGFGEYTGRERSVQQMGEFGFLPKTESLSFPCAKLRGYVVERDNFNPTPGGPTPFAGADITGNLVGDDGTTISPFVQASTQQAPTVTSLSVTSGTVAGGTSVTVTGTLFLAGFSAYFGPASSPSYCATTSYGSAQSIGLSTPAVPNRGIYDLTIVNRDGQKVVFPQCFTFT